MPGLLKLAFGYTCTTFIYDGILLVTGLPVCLET